jgi:hypothetical protein
MFLVGFRTAEEWAPTSRLEHLRKCRGGRPLVSRLGREFLSLARQTCEILSFSEKGTKKAVVPEEAGFCVGIQDFR